MKCTLEERVGRKFEIYKALTYRQSPYIPSPPGGGPGPELPEVDYLIKVWYYLYSCTHTSFFYSCMFSQSSSIWQFHTEIWTTKLNKIFISYIHRLRQSQRHRAIILLWKSIIRVKHIHYWLISQIWIFMLLLTSFAFLVLVEIWDDLSIVPGAYKQLIVVITSFTFTSCYFSSLEWPFEVLFY